MFRSPFGGPKLELEDDDDDSLDLLKHPIHIKPQPRDIHQNFDVKTDDEIENVDQEISAVYTVVGCVVKMAGDHVLLYSPIRDIWKVLVRPCHLHNSPFMQSGHRLKLGSWMTVDCVERQKQEYDEKQPPRFSHIVIEPVKYINIRSLFPSWEQRFIDGIFQVKVTVDLSKQDAIQLLEESNDGLRYYLAVSDTSVAVIVPFHRLGSILRNGHKPPAKLRFWANRGRQMFGYCIHLFEDEPIDEVLSDGSKQRHLSPLKHPEEYKKEPAETKEFEEAVPQQSEPQSSATTPAPQHVETPRGAESVADPMYRLATAVLSHVDQNEMLNFGPDFAKDLGIVAEYALHHSNRAAHLSSGDSNRL